MVAARQRAQVGQVLAVERDEIVEAREIIRYDDPRAMSIVNAPLTQHPARAVVRRLADVPGAGAGRVGHDAIGQPGLRDQVAKHRFGHRRAADIAEADEQDIDRLARCISHGLSPTTADYDRYSFNMRIAMRCSINGYQCWGVQLNAPALIAEDVHCRALSCIVFS